MRFTSADLLNVMGLKLNDKINFNGSVGKVYNDDVFGISILYRNQILKLETLIGVDYTIIQPKPTLTEDEESKLKGLDKKWKWIARSEWEHNLALYTEKPIRSFPSHDEIHDEREWKIEKGSEYTEIRQYNHLFQFIKWEDEPYSIEELLKE